MDVNLIVFIVGCVIVVGTLLFNIYSNNNRSQAQLQSVYETNMNQFTNNVSSNNKNSNDIEQLKREVISIQKELSTVLEILNTNLMNTVIEPVEDLKPDTKNSKIGSFSNILNYSKFLSNNKDIIDRYKNNKSIEEIAKELNKSIREVEMVIKLIK
ncbi:hypothetical protein [Serpentinicella alkaliphila]|uniref:Uncharacterized protein n=1 Tax=Serpentinicella alkaliphila TaxID=1734049 RepID=A0A4R2TQ29_9FIRM|nr:hypothetical protein [Serpentinicella alkaliphila]QUH26308.1 hypothetical protein HZR23_11585 [Serpentinicella alkaliphila]TCQ05888.1 hypothetical protein EDD79_100469 [Serpentinicella alkaliphila]